MTITSTLKITHTHKHKESTVVLQREIMVAWTSAGGSEQGENWAELREIKGDYQFPGLSS